MNIKFLLSIILILSFYLFPPVAFTAVPTPDFTGAPTKGCNYMSVQFTDASTGGDGATGSLSEASICILSQ